MCGFACELRVGELADVKAVARMAATMDDRGPDGSGTWASGSLVLSFRRLKIIDLSEHVSQPMTDPELGLTITFNDCIYNYPELSYARSYPERATASSRPPTPRSS